MPAKSAGFFVSYFIRLCQLLFWRWLHTYQGKSRQFQTRFVLQQCRAPLTISFVVSFIPGSKFSCAFWAFAVLRCFHCGYTLHRIPSLLKLRAMYALLMLIALAALQVPTPTPAQASKPQKHQATDAQQQTGDDQCGSEKLPIFVKTIPATKTKEEAAQESQDRADKTANDRELVVLTARYVVFTGLIVAIGVLQLVVFGYQSIQLSKTVKAAGEQSEAMERYIGQATRSADAMENIANVIESGNKAIIRAYLSVVIGGALYQERNDGVKFEGKPTLVNTGSTPARNIKIRIAAEIVPYAQAETFTYPVPQEVAKAPAVTAPHQNYILSAIVKDFVPDADIPDIKHGREGKGALTVWGTVTYDDIFGQPHTTKFAQWLFWYPNQTVYGYYIPGQNDMD